MQPSFILLNAKDNVVMPTCDLPAGTTCPVTGLSRTLTVKEFIPFGHKVALSSLEENADIIKYGEVIAKAKIAITEGQHIHIHNMVNIIG